MIVDIPFMMSYLNYKSHRGPLSSSLSSPSTYYFIRYLLTTSQMEGLIMMMMIMVFVSFVLARSSKPLVGPQLTKVISTMFVANMYLNSNVASF